MTLKLIIGSKNVSSWSLRPWLLMTQSGIAFEENKILLDRPETRKALRAATPSGLVPCLVDGAFEIWDSLAIAEYLNDLYPEKNLWPRDRHARARARSIVAEMHSGFSDLRTVWPMDFARENLGVYILPPVRRDIERVLHLWEEARRLFGEPQSGADGGPFLFGRFSIADAFFAPVVSRFSTYGPLEMPSRAQEWFSMMRGLPAMDAWAQEARREEGL